jgi:cardiolipin synthase
VLDPLADKLMSGAVLISLAIAGAAPWWIAALFCVKEALMGVGALVQFKRIDDVPAARLYGKASAVTFFLALVAVMLFSPPEPWPTVFLSCALALTLAAFVLYLRRYIKIKSFQEKH